MIAIFTAEEKTTKINVSFSDEGVELTGETSVLGNEARARDYLPFFEKDLRNNFADKFPQPELPVGGMMGGLE